MSIEAIDRIARPLRRRKAVYGLVVLLGSVGLFYALTGGFPNGPKVLIGRKWGADERTSIEEIDHGEWDRLLRRYADEVGDVDYSGWKGTPADVEGLDAYLTGLSRADPAQSAGREPRLAFWINAYNASTIRGILREYPTSSIQRHAAHLWGYNIWRDLLLQVGDQRYSLGQIEHEVLRPLNEPRIHFAIVCASRGCPPLLNRAYTARDLERQLSDNSRNFFADPRKLEYDRASATLWLSPILKWYAADFGPTEAAMLQTIARYLPRDLASLPGSFGLRVRYLDYDWNLNDQAAESNGAPAPPDEPFEETKS
jgi:hypothetical protein